MNSSASSALGAISRRPAHDRQVDFVVAQMPRQRLAVADREPHLHARVLGAKPRQQARQEVFRGAYHADGHAAALSPPQLRHDIAGLLQRGKHPPRIHQQVLPRHRKPDRFARPLEQRQLHGRLQFLDLHGNRGLRDVQSPGRPGEAQVLRDRREYL